MLRSIAAIAAGFLFIFVLSFGADAALRAAMPSAFSPSGRVDSIPVLLLIQAYVLVFAVSGCYLTARLAPNRPLRHALILGLLGLAFNIVGRAIMWDTAPAWDHVMGIALVMPAAWLGGRLRELQLERSGALTPATT
jgi:hypothetical protein